MNAHWKLACLPAAFVASGLACSDVSPEGEGQALADASLPTPSSDARTQVGCTETEPCYTVYAHSDDVLYHIDLAQKALVQIGPFNTPGGDVITDLAVSPQDGLWGVSESSFLYSVNPSTGAADQITSLATCGTFSVALTFTPDGNLYAGDFSGAFCRIDISKTPPQVTPIGTLGNNLALAGDIVAVSDGTLFGTAYDLTNGSTQSSNILVTIDPATGQATPIGSSGYPNLYGVAFEQERVFGFTHDGSGRVVTLDPSTGSGTLYGTFNAPGTDNPIAFAGAAVNPNVPPVIE